MEAKFDPKAKVKQGQFSDAPDGKQPNREHTNIDFAMVMCAPYICFNGFDYKVKVNPSGKKND